MTIYIIPPTVLYILQHSVTGLKYFGKTTQDIRKYKGSGVRWTNHIKKHGRKYIITIWVSDPYIDSDAIVEFALAFSKEHNIVESKDWANIRPENGLDGGVAGIPRSDKTKQKISTTKKGKPGKPRSTETRQKQSAAATGRIYKLVTCPHCGKIGSNMNRWHFDNCKSKPI
jgi:hypothetical protein